MCMPPKYGRNKNKLPRKAGRMSLIAAILGSPDAIIVYMVSRGVQPPWRSKAFSEGLKRGLRFIPGSACIRNSEGIHIEPGLARGYRYTLG
jgi:hypothetical protein